MFSFIKHRNENKLNHCGDTKVTSHKLGLRLITHNIKISQTSQGKDISNLVKNGSNDIYTPIPNHIR